MRACDVLIIGAGPGGSAAAITAALAGLRVLVLERLRFPRHRPGETLPPGAEPLFRQLGVWEAIERAGFIRHPGQRVAWAGDAKFSRFGGTAEEPWLGFQAWRSVLDAALLQRAVSLGVEVWQPCRAVSPMFAGARVCGVVTDRGEVRARHVVDAAGGGGWLARKLGEPAEQHSPRLLASYGYVETERAADWGIPELQSVAGGWIWMAQVQPRIVAWTRLSLDGRRGDAPRQLAELRDAHPLRLGGTSADVTWRLAPRSAGPGYFLVGDAALVLDPASSHGVLRALMSGIMAGDRLAQICRDRVPEELATAEYSRWIRAWFAHDSKKLAGFYGEIADLPAWLAPNREEPEWAETSA